MLKSLHDIDQPACCTLDELPGRLKARYRRLALITSRHHLHQLDPADENTLIVSCDWLLWQRELTAGRQIAYYELGIRDWDKPDSLATDLFLRANDWIPEVDGGDPTLFRNVSLGRLFGAEVSMVMMNYYRLERALRKLIERFRPIEILFFDFTYDVNVLNAPLRKLLVEAVARDCGVIVTDRSGEVPANDHGIADVIYQRRGHSLAVRAILAAYSWLLATLTQIRCMISPRDRRVLVLVNVNMAEPLVRNYFGSGLAPVFIARAIPRKIGLLWHCLCQGVRLVGTKTASLSSEDASRVREICETLRRVLPATGAGPLAFVRTYVRQEILDAGRFEDAAKEVRAAERLLDHLLPQRIVVDGVRNGLPRISIELAYARGIAIDYIWHSILMPQNIKFDALGGDPRYARRVTRFLTWGRINERWLDSVAAAAERVRIGSPVRDHYAGWQWRKTSNMNRILLLQYTFLVTDLNGLNANMYENFVGTVRTLRRLGYADVRFKLHPGPGRWKKSYFENIANYFGLDCPILKSEPFHELLASADEVIGPATSGAMPESLAAGKPYHAVLLAPHSMDTGYYDEFPLITSVVQLEKTLGRKPDAADHRFLDDLYSTDDIPNPSQRFWDVLHNDFN